MAALLSGVIDYAGLFPPAALAMADAIRAYALYLDSESAWMLGRFVVPATRLEELAEHATPVWQSGRRWHVSAVGTASDLDAVASFSARHADRACVDSFETRATSVVEIRTLAGRCTSPLLRLHVELPLTAALESLVRAVRDAGAVAKVRTGGVTTEAFPSAGALAEFLLLCARHEVPFKATAGLHHPLRGEYPLTYDAGSPRATMFGFVNVFLAALLAREGADQRTLESLLTEREGSSITADASGIAWRGHRVSAERVREGRACSAVSFGSCSFTEPVHDLATLGFA